MTIVGVVMCSFQIRTIQTYIPNIYVEEWRFDTIILEPAFSPIYPRQAILGRAVFSRDTLPTNKRPLLVRYFQ